MCKSKLTLKNIEIAEIFLKLRIILCSIFSNTPRLCISGWNMRHIYLYNSGEARYWRKNFNIP